MTVNLKHMSTLRGIMLGGEKGLMAVYLVVGFFVLAHAFPGG